MSAEALVAIDVVVPAFNEATLLPVFVHDLAAVLAAVTDLSVRLIIVDDGSNSDARETYRLAVAAFNARFLHGPHEAELVTLPKNRGKGAAIRAGWANARESAQWLGFVDGDGAISASEFVRIVRLCPGSKSDGLLGARIRMAGRTIVRSLRRHLQGRVFATLVTNLLNVVMYDSQCGFKLFTASTLRPILNDLQEDRWLLDVEIMTLLLARNANLEEVPVDFNDLGDSKVSALDPLFMASGLWNLRRRLQRRGIAL